MTEYEMIWEMFTIIEDLPIHPKESMGKDLYQKVYNYLYHDEEFFNDPESMELDSDACFDDEDNEEEEIFGGDDDI